LSLVQCFAHAVGSEDLLGRHLVVADAVGIDQVRLLDLELSQVLLQELKGLLAVRLGAFRDQEDLFAAFLEDVAEVNLGLTIAGELGGGVKVSQATVDALVEKGDGLLLGPEAGRGRSKAEDGDLNLGPAQDLLRQDGFVLRRQAGGTSQGSSRTGSLEEIAAGNAIRGMAGRHGELAPPEIQRYKPPFGARRCP